MPCETKKQYDVAAYIWPAYTGTDLRTRMFWEEGIGEWQSVKNARCKFEGHSWPRKPVWGYVNEADPCVMEMEIEAATEHGVNVFIYDWYWYDNRPFLENCLNEGFLKAKNNGKIKFYIMWANHDANYTWDIRNSNLENVTIWGGAVDQKQFRIVGKRLIEQYFLHPSYYKIDNKPVFSIYDISKLINGLGGIENTRREIAWLQNEALKAGLSGVHMQAVKWGDIPMNLSGVDGDVTASFIDLLKDLNCFCSLTHYQFVHFTNIDRNYADIIPDVEKEWKKIRNIYKIPYFPHVSVGWDNNPRFQGFRAGIVKGNTPEEFEKMLRLAKDYSDANNSVPLITINSWNEWTESSYLQPDDLYGYGYLQAIKRVFK